MNLLPHVSTFLSESADDVQMIARMNLIEDFAQYSIPKFNEAIITLNKALNLTWIMHQYRMNNMEPQEKSHVRQIIKESSNAVALAAFLTSDENRQLHEILTEAKKIRLLYERVTTNT